MRRAAIALFLMLPALRASASTILLADNFDSYTTGELNKNGAGSPNAAPNGSGNPWWGPLGTMSGITLAPSDIVGAENGITPHSGSQMVAGTADDGSVSTVWNNIAFRNNSGNTFSGNLTETFWFYDPNGTSNGKNFAGYSSIAYYNTNSSSADYPSTQTLNDSTTIERLSLGGASYQKNTSGYPQTYDSTEYQARIVNSTLGYAANGWINLPMTRSVGWHEGEIVVGPANANGSNSVSYYIDNLTTPLLTATTVIDKGYTDLELSSGPDGSSSATNAGAYFDDVTLTETPEPASLILLSTAGLVLLRRR